MFVCCLANESVGNPESSGEDTSDSDDDTSANGPEAADRVCLQCIISVIRRPEFALSVVTGLIVACCVCLSVALMHCSKAVRASNVILCTGAGTPQEGKMWVVRTGKSEFAFGIAAKITLELPQSC